MNILHVIAAPAAGGAEVYVKDLSRKLVESGQDVHIGFLTHAEEIGRSPEFERTFLSELDRAGISYFFIGNQVRSRPWVGMRRVRAYVSANDIDVYHAHLSYGVVLGAVAAAPRVYTHHNIRMRVSRPVFRMISPFIDQLVGISENCSSVLRDFSRREVVTIMNAIDQRRTPAAKPRDYSLGTKVRCLAVGYIGEQKHYELMIRAISDLPPDRRSQIELCIVGEGSDEYVRALLGLIEQESLGGTVRLLGNCNDVPCLMANSDLYLMSSRYEGLPIALIESVSMGLPCVVTDVGGCSEVIRLCNNGLMVQPDDAAAFSEAVLELLDDPRRLRQMSENAVRCRHLFAIERAAEDHLAVYRGLV